MTPTDSAIFAVELARLAETFGEPISQARIEGYFMALEAIPLEDAVRAMRTAARTRTFFPRPVELIEQIEGSADERGVLAWSVIERAACRCLEPDLREDPAAADALTLMGGWREVRCVGHRDIAEVTVATMRKEFLAFYRITATRRTGPAALTAKMDRALLADPSATMPALPPAPSAESESKVRELVADTLANMSTVARPTATPAPVDEVPAKSLAELTEEVATLRERDAADPELVRRRRAALDRFAEHTGQDGCHYADH